jgi:uncharacterized protein (UPF0332 family)
MSISPLDILDFAERCSKNQQEVDYRNAIARAYYASYHRVLAHMKNAPSSKGISAHQSLLDYLNKDAHELEVSLKSAESKALGYMLLSLKIRRGASDYKLGDMFTQAQAETAIQDAKKIFSKCDLIFN